MKISQLILMGGALAAAVSCAALGEEDQGAADRGGEIRFGVTATAPEGVLPETKTTYGSVSGSTKILTWAEGDRISIYAPNEYNFYGAAFDNQIPAVSYTIGGQSLSGTVSTATGVTAVTAALALQWGTATGASSHKFYGMYPDPSAYDADTAPANTPYTYEDFRNQNTRSRYFTCYLPEEQGAVVTDTYNFSNDMRYAYMTAYAGVERNAAVTLNFVPRYSVFEVSIGNAYVGEDFRVSAVELVASAQRLSGPYSVNIETGAYTIAAASGDADRTVSKTFATPLTVPNGTSLKITFFTCPVAVAGSDEDNLTLKLTMEGGDEWYLPLKYSSDAWLSFQAGKYYAINCGAAPDPFVYEVTTDAQELTIDTQGTSSTGTLTLTSTKNKAGVITAAPWKVQYSTDGGTWSDNSSVFTGQLSSLSVSPSSGSGSTSGETITVSMPGGTVQSTTGTVPATFRPALGNTSSTARDLSYYNGVTDEAEESQETANSYIIRAQGWYKFPLAYGNSLKGGSANSPAFTNQTTTSNSSYMGTNTSNSEQPFVDGTGTSITAENYTISNASSVYIVWQDCTADVITDLSINDGYVVFQVTDAIQPCNVVMGVKNNTNVTIWSWHIWMVSDELGLTTKTVTTHSVYGGKDRNMLTANLGELPPTSATVNSYPAQTAYIRFVSTVNQSVLRQVTLIRPAYSSGYTNPQGGGICPHYQWGRKDPMLTPSVSGGDRTYNGTTAGSSYKGAAEFVKNTAAGKNITYAAAHPNEFLLYNSSYNYNWYAHATWYNMWDTAQTGTDDNSSPKKSVYDPCPRGYRVAGKYDFTGFTTTGGACTDQNQFNIIAGSGFSKGWFFKCKSSEDSEGIFFPASGYRSSSNGSIYSVGSNGYYWSSSSGDAGYGSYLRFDSGSVYPLYYNDRAYGFAVRPAQE